MVWRVCLHRAAQRCAPFLSPPPPPIFQPTSPLPAIQSLLADFPRLSAPCHPYGPVKGFSRLPFSRCSGITAPICKQKPVFCSSRKTSVQASADKSDSEPQRSEMKASTGRRFAVLVTGHASEYTDRTYGGYGNMFVRLLEDPGEVWDVFPVVEGKFPTEEELAKYEGFVLTGSRHDAHANDGWILQLCSVLQSLHEKRKKMLGVCFGHQVDCVLVNRC